MYDFKVEYRQGIDNGNADGLSRLLDTLSQASVDPDNQAWVGTVSAADSSSHIPASAVVASQMQKDIKLSRTGTLAVSAADSSSHARNPKVAF